MIRTTLIFLIILAGPLMAQDEESQIGNEITARISSEAAGMLTYLMEQCAAIAGDISEERMAEGRAGLSADREMLKGAEDIFDTHFEIGRQRAAAGEAPEATETSCAKAIAVLRSNEPVTPPR